MRRSRSSSPSDSMVDVRRRTRTEPNPPDAGRSRITPRRGRPHLIPPRPRHHPWPMEHLVQLEAPQKAARVLASFTVNGDPVTVAIAPHATVLEVVREDLGLTGTKHGCELGECGTCTVLIDDVPVLSCLALALSHRDSRIDTVEGMARDGGLHPLQDAFAELGAAQCGYCTPGFLIAAQALLRAEPSPSRDRIRGALSGNLCRCTGYLKIYEAVELAAQRMAAASPVAR